jgi:hypothetical protein
MTGFLLSDGAELVGGKTADGAGQGLALDLEGNLLTNNHVYDQNSAQSFEALGVAGVTEVTVGGHASTPVGAGAGNTIIKSSPGRLARILVTATGTAAFVVYDNASAPSGTIIAVVPANALAGTIIDAQAPALNGMTLAGNPDNPGVTVFYD